MLGIEYSPCYHCDKTKCSFCELTRYKDSQQKEEASEMAELKTKADCEVNPQPARWIRTRKGNGWDDWADYTCPACKTEFDGSHITWDMNYCPSCGREMEREK